MKGIRAFDGRPDQMQRYPVPGGEVVQAWECTWTRGDRRSEVRYSQKLALDALGEGANITRLAIVRLDGGGREYHPGADAYEHAMWRRQQHQETVQQAMDAPS